MRDPSRDSSVRRTSIGDNSAYQSMDVGKAKLFSSFQQQDTCENQYVKDLNAA